MDNVSFQQVINRTALLKYQYLGSAPYDYVPILPKETFAIIETQPSFMQAEQGIMLANCCQSFVICKHLWK